MSSHQVAVFENAVLEGAICKDAFAENALHKRAVVELLCLEMLALVQPMLERLRVECVLLSQYAHVGSFLQPEIVSIVAWQRIDGITRGYSDYLPPVARASGLYSCYNIFLLAKIRKWAAAMDFHQWRLLFFSASGEERRTVVMGFW